MSSVVSSTPQRVINRRSLNDVKVDSSECLDLSIKEFFVIVYYTASDPGNEYEILSEKDLVDTWEMLEKGVIVTIKFGNARVQATVVTVSDDLGYLNSNFKAITEEYQDFIEKQNNGKKQFAFPANRTGCSERHIIKVMDKETQTEGPSFEGNSLTNTDFAELKKKYEELKTDFDRFTSLFSDVKINLEETLVKLDSIKTGGNSKNLVPVPVATYEQNTVLRSKENGQENDNFNQMIQIGSEGTAIPKNIYDSISWSSYTAATRKLLITLFPRKVLATHSLTGKPSPAFLTCEKQKKMRLDPSIISDIVELISKNCKVSESLVRSVITTKCADENKMYRKRMQKRRGSEAENDINDIKRTKK